MGSFQPLELQELVCTLLEILQVLAWARPSALVRLRQPESSAIFSCIWVMRARMTTPPWPGGEYYYSCRCHGKTKRAISAPSKPLKLKLAGHILYNRVKLLTRLRTEGFHVRHRFVLAIFAIRSEI